MERYGGGLPAQAESSSPRTTTQPASRPSPSPTPRPTVKTAADDPYHAGDYAHPDDFYEDHYDDFWDYEDAEDYWEDAH